MKRLSLEDAKLLYARGMQEQKAIRKKFAAQRQSDVPAYEEAKKHWRHSHHKNQALMNQFAADPELRSHMTPWMMDFHGSQEPTWVKEGRLPTEQEANLLLRGVAMDLAEVIHEWLNSHGFRVSDSGGGRGGWDLGVLCDDLEAVRLSALVQSELRRYIDAGLLNVQLKFWGWRFRNSEAQDDQN